LNNENQKGTHAKIQTAVEGVLLHVKTLLEKFSNFGKGDYSALLPKGRQRKKDCLTLYHSSFFGNS